MRSLKQLRRGVAFVGRVLLGAMLAWTGEQAAAANPKGPGHSGRPMDKKAGSGFAQGDLSSLRNRLSATLPTTGVTTLIHALERTRRLRTSLSTVSATGYSLIDQLMADVAEIVPALGPSAEPSYQSLNHEIHGSGHTFIDEAGRYIKALTDTPLDSPRRDKDPLILAVGRRVEMTGEVTMEVSPSFRTVRATRWAPTPTHVRYLNMRLEGGSESSSTALQFETVTDWYFCDGALPKLITNLDFRDKGYSPTTLLNTSVDAAIAHVKASATLPSVAKLALPTLRAVRAAGAALENRPGNSALFDLGISDKSAIILKTVDAYGRQVRVKAGGLDQEEQNISVSLVEELGKNARNITKERLRNGSYRDVSIAAGKLSVHERYTHAGKRIVELHTEVTPQQDHGVRTWPMSGVVVDRTVTRWKPSLAPGGS